MNPYYQQATKAVCKTKTPLAMLGSTLAVWAFSLLAIEKQKRARDVSYTDYEEYQEIERRILEDSVFPS